jgi:hypothetical protein
VSATTNYPLLTYIATVIMIAGIGASAIMFALMAPTAGEWQRRTLAMRPTHPENVRDDSEDSPA